MYGIGRSRTCVAILKKAHLCEVIVTYRPMILKTLSPERKIFVSEQFTSLGGRLTSRSHQYCFSGAAASAGNEYPAISVHHEDLQDNRRSQIGLNGIQCIGTKLGSRIRGPQPNQELQVVAARQQHRHATQNRIHLPVQADPLVEYIHLVYPQLGSRDRRPGGIASIQIIVPCSKFCIAVQLLKDSWGQFGPTAGSGSKNQSVGQ